MAYSKARRLSDLISADGTSFVTAAHITDGVVAAADLHSTLDLTGKTVTVATASAGDNDTTVASTAFVSTAVSNLVDSAPGTLNTLNELAAALGDDANFSTTVTNSIATKLPLAGGTMTGDITASQSVFNITNNDFRLKTSGAETMLRAVANGAVEIMHDNSTKLATTSSGVTVTGAITASSVNASGGFLNGANGGIRIHTGGTKFFNVTAANAARDNIMDIGASDARFKDLHLAGAAYVDGGAIFNEDSADVDFRVESNDHTHMLFVDGGTNRVGINNPSSATAPVFPFVVWDDDEVTILGHGNNATYIQRYQTHTTAPATLVMDKARGTQASPTTVAPGDDLGRIIMRGYTNNGYYEAASIHAEANTSNLVNNGADIPSDLYFKTTRDGGSGPLERMRIDYDGGIWHRHGSYGKYSWGKGVVFSAGQTQNLYFHLNGSNVFGSIRVHLAGDYGNVNTNGAMENVWGWGYNSSNQSQYGGGGGGTATIREGSTSNVFSFGSMTKTNNTTVKIPITNGNGSYQIHTAIFVEVIGEIAGLGYVSIS